MCLHSTISLPSQELSRQGRRTDWSKDLSRIRCMSGARPISVIYHCSQTQKSCAFVRGKSASGEPNVWDIPHTHFPDPTEGKPIRRQDSEPAAYLFATRHL